MTPLERENAQIREALARITEERDELKERLALRLGEDERALVAATYNFTSSEAKLVHALYRYEKPMSRDALLDALYADRVYGTEPEVKVLDVFICKIRKKFGTKGSIRNVWGRGYELTDVGRVLLTQRIEGIKARRAAA